MWKSCLVAAGSFLILLSSAAAQESFGQLHPRVFYDGIAEQVDSTYKLVLYNSGDAPLTGTVETVRHTWPEYDWLGATPSAVVVAPDGRDTIRVTVRRSLLPPYVPGVLRARLEGSVRIIVDPPTATDTVGSFFIIELQDLPRDYEYDTISTSCLSLVVSSHGNLGGSGGFGSGGVNMNFDADCDDHDSIPGIAEVYLYDASPVVFSSETSGTWSMYPSGFADDHEFVSIADECRGVFSSTNYSFYYSHTMVTRDSALEVETNLYAPAAADSCEFLIYRLEIRSPDATPFDDLTIGFAADWDIPSDSFAWNSVGRDLLWGVYWQRGLEYDEPIGDSLECQQNSARFGGLGMIGYRDGTGENFPATPVSVTYTPFMSLLNHGPEIDSSVLYSELTSGDQPLPQDSTEDRVMIVSLLDAYDLAATDTLEIWLALGAVENGTESDMIQAIEKARAWFADNSPLPSVPAGCGPACIRTGDVNMDGQTNLTDLTIMVNCLFVSFDCSLIVYRPAANTSGDQNCDINLTDLTALVNSLFVTFEPLPLCTSFDYTLCF